MTDDLFIMPPENPMAMPAQNFRAAFRDVSVPDCEPQRNVAIWRLLALSPAAAASGLLLLVMYGWFSDHGISLLEGILLSLISFNFFWITFTVSTVVLGMLSLLRKSAPKAVSPARSLNVALLVPVFNELPWFVMGNARSMLEELAANPGPHRYAMFILSDTRDDEIAAQEQASIQALSNSLSPEIEIYYRRRAQNTDRKVGNIADWVSRWGGNWDAMLVLDADSLMTGQAICNLADALAGDPGAGLVQSFPQLIGAESIFARMQQFANGVYGATLAEGMARWCGQEGNYWGHNAIMRTRAFAQCAGLPKLKNLRGQDRLIMSHDFVEAGLLRRAGWSVRFLPRIRGSFEGTPATLVDHILRDRRWCQGNLQHLTLLNSRGFASMSRFHLLQGAIGYLLSPIWFALLVMWALIGRGEDASVLTYFSETNPLMPTWPEMTEVRHVVIILLMYAMLLAPKFLGAAALPLAGVRMSEFGGRSRFWLSFLSEVFLAIVYAPILMVQQMIAVFRTLLGIQRGWTPQPREGGQYGLKTLAVCHALETVSGLALTTGIVAGLVSFWLAPIALSLLLAVPLSALSGKTLSGSARLWMRTPAELHEPEVTQTARRYRAELRYFLQGPGNTTPAE